MRPIAFRTAVVIGSLLAAVVGGCGGTATQLPASRTAVVRVSQRDFRIVLRPFRVPPGRIRFVVRNSGPDDHEFIVLRGSAKLPLRADGLTVDEEALHARTVVSLPPAGPGASRTVSVNVTPGRYQVICNMAGHFLGGMNAILVVRR